MVAFDALPLPPASLGESPLWHAVQDLLYWVDIPGRALHSYDPDRRAHRCWPLDSEPASLAP
ncbi:MAG: SMP-30/gluconolactonase/LRE family protein, partial [Aquabacterium sp.]